MAYVDSLLNDKVESSECPSDMTLCILAEWFYWLVNLKDRQPTSVQIQPWTVTITARAQYLTPLLKFVCHVPNDNFESQNGRNTHFDNDYYYAYIITITITLTITISLFDEWKIWMVEPIFPNTTKLCKLTASDSNI